MEAAFLQWLRPQLASPAARQLLDDAAVLESPARVVTTDLLLEGVHFELSQCGAERAGRKALAASLSDLAAMAAAPRAAVVSLALPRRQASETARGVMQGMLPLARQHQLEIVGGDTNTWDGPLAINVAAWGDPLHGLLSRDGGKIGDVLAVTGQLGGSLLGHHLDFQPRVSESLWLMEHCRPHAGMDISDGLALDLSRLVSASQCGAVVVERRVPIADAARQRAAQSQQTPLAHSLNDGEDFELLLAMPAELAKRAASELPRACGTSLTIIGRLVPSGLWLERDDGALDPLPDDGYLHREAAP